NTGTQGEKQSPCVCHGRVSCAEAPTRGRGVLVLVVLERGAVAGFPRRRGSAAWWVVLGRTNDQGPFPGSSACPWRCVLHACGCAAGRGVDSGAGGAISGPGRHPALLASSSSPAASGRVTETRWQSVRRCRETPRRERWRSSPPPGTPAVSRRASRRAVPAADQPARGRRPCRQSPTRRPRDRRSACPLGLLSVAWRAGSASVGHLPRPPHPPPDHGRGLSPRRVAMVLPPVPVGRVLSAPGDGLLPAAGVTGLTPAPATATSSAQ